MISRELYFDDINFFLGTYVFDNIMRNIEICNKS